MRHLAARNFRPDSYRALDLAIKEREAAEDATHYANRLRIEPGSVALAWDLKRATIARALACVALGRLMQDQEMAEGDVATLGSRRYALDLMGNATYVGPALPEGDDEIEDETPERRSEYHAMTFAG